MKLIKTFLFLTSALLFPDNWIFAQNGNNQWKLIWEDQFEGNELDTTKWMLISTQPVRPCA